MHETMGREVEAGEPPERAEEEPPDEEDPERAWTWATATGM